jgi:hypothetical protein
MALSNNPSDEVARFGDSFLVLSPRIVSSLFPLVRHGQEGEDARRYLYTVGRVQVVATTLRFPRASLF